MFLSFILSLFFFLYSFFLFLYSFTLPFTFIMLGGHLCYVFVICSLSGIVSPQSKALYFLGLSPRCSFILSLVLLDFLESCVPSFSSCSHHRPSFSRACIIEVFFLALFVKFLSPFILVLVVVNFVLSHNFLLLPVLQRIPSPLIQKVFSFLL